MGNVWLLGPSFTWVLYTSHIALSQLKEIVSFVNSTYLGSQSNILGRHLWNLHQVSKNGSCNPVYKNLASESSPSLSSFPSLFLLQK